MKRLNELKEKFKKIAITVIVISIVLWIITVIINIQFALHALYILVILDIIILAILYHNMVKLPFKMEFVGKILSEYKPSIKYKYKFKGDNYKEIIKDNHLISSATSFSFTDLIEDDVDGVKYFSMDLHATHTQSTGKSTTTITDFKGRVFDCEVGKNYCDYVLKEERWKNVPKGYIFLDLEVISFNKKFNLYVKDTHEAHKIFTPSKIKNLMELEAKYDNIMTVCHIDNHLYIFIYDSSDIFENMEDPYKVIIEEYNKQISLLKDYLEVVNE